MSILTQSAFGTCRDHQEFTVTAFTFHGVNTLRLRQNCCKFPDNIFKCIFLNENVWISIEISLKYVIKDLINNIPASVQIMAWHQPGYKSLSKPMMVSLLTHICITRTQWFNHHPLGEIFVSDKCGLLPWSVVGSKCSHPSPFYWWPGAWVTEKFPC